MTARKPKSSNLKIIEMLILFAAGTWLLIAALKAGTELAVPYDYDAVIDEYAREFDLDKALVAAVIYQESRFNPTAVSSQGATGLMQIMPETGRWLAERLNIKYAEERLKEPEYNVRMGTYYLDYLMKKYRGDEELVLAAYNAGPGNVDKWLKNDSYSEDGALTRIPFRETREYVPKVQQMKAVYRSLYSGRFKVSP